MACSDIQGGGSYLAKMSIPLLALEASLGSTPISEYFATKYTFFSRIILKSVISYHLAARGPSPFSFWSFFVPSPTRWRRSIATRVRSKPAFPGVSFKTFEGFERQRCHILHTTPNTKSLGVHTWKEIRDMDDKRLGTRRRSHDKHNGCMESSTFRTGYKNTSCPVYLIPLPQFND